MKIALPTRGTVIDDHFGHCEYYTIFTIENNEISSKETLPSPNGCGCKSNIASKLHEMGVTLMIAGNMGDGAKDKLGRSNINVIRGCHGELETVVKSYLSGEVIDSGKSCAGHHDGNHVCHHGNN